jgi:hypothetical protein
MEVLINGGIGPTFKYTLVWFIQHSGVDYGRIPKQKLEAAMNAGIQK